MQIIYFLVKIPIISLILLKNKNKDFHFFNNKLLKSRFKNLLLKRNAFIFLFIIKMFLVKSK